MSKKTEQEIRAELLRSDPVYLTDEDLQDIGGGLAISIFANNKKKGCTQGSTGNCGEAGTLCSTCTKITTDTDPKLAWVTKYP